MSQQVDPNELQNIGSSLILATKLHRPFLLPGLQPRANLMAQLEANVYCPLTLISAPAGYGKSTLASMWLEASDAPSAWLSLDEHDNDLRTFVTYVVTAISSVFPDLEPSTRYLLSAPTLPPAAIFARYLLNDLARVNKPFVLVLDDLHHVREPTIYELLNELLRHPAQVMHMVLISRRDPPLPIASLRAHSQVNEIRVRDLRFTTAETAGFLSRGLQRPVSEAVAAEWTAQTEGWVTALQLASLSLRHRDQADDLSINFQRTGRYLEEYLLADVLAQLPHPQRDWLLASLLLDRFCASLCDAVCQSDGTNEQDMLTGEKFIRWLQQDNLFLIQLDDEGRWHRFHHLIQELLRNRLVVDRQPDEIAALHLRASVWFAQNGMLEEAIRHAVAAGDSAAAVQIVAEHRYALMYTEQWNRLDQWLKLLPTEIVAESAMLMSLLAHVNMMNDGGEWYSIWQRADGLLATLPPQAAETRVVQGELAAVKGLYDIVLGHPKMARANAQCSLALLPPDAQYLRNLALGVLAGSLQMDGQFDQCMSLLSEAIINFVGPPNTLSLKCMGYAATACLMEGDLPGVLAWAGKALNTSKELQFFKQKSALRCSLGVAHYLRDEVEDAKRYLLPLLEDRVVAAPTYLVMGTCALALIYVAQDQFAEAVRVLDAVHSQLKDVNEDEFALATAEAFAVELELRANNLTDARRKSVGVNFDMRAPHWFFYVPQLTPVKLLVAESTPASLADARAQLQALDEQMRMIHRNLVRINTLALLALVCQAQHDMPAAHTVVTEALNLGERGGFIRNFVDLGHPMARLLAELRQRHPADTDIPSAYLDQVLAAFPISDRTGVQILPAASNPQEIEHSNGLVEQLTARELQILRRLTTEQSPDDIAEELVVSISTVRSHIQNLYRKLDVHNRYEAVDRSQKLGLL